MPNNVLSKKIDEVSDGLIGLLTALLRARKTLGDKHLNTFLDKVPEKGEALWELFKAFQQANRDKGNKIEMTFNHFIASVIFQEE